MRTVGIDVAAQHAKTPTCWIEWTGGSATIDDETLAVLDDDDIRRCVQKEGWIALPIPGSVTRAREPTLTCPNPG